MIRARLSRRSHDIDHARSFGDDTAWYILIMQRQERKMIAHMRWLWTFQGSQMKKGGLKWEKVQENLWISPKTLTPPFHDFPESMNNAWNNIYLRFIGQSLFAVHQSVFWCSLLFGGTSGSVSKSSKWVGLGKLTRSFATAGEEEDSPGKKRIRQIHGKKVKEIEEEKNGPNKSQIYKKAYLPIQ